jgi:hypothetical protein
VRHRAIGRAAEFLLGSQTPEGDLRGIYATQYTPTYTAAILAVLVEAGLGGNPRIVRCYEWFAAMRQEDGGWAIPLRTRGATFPDSAAGPADRAGSHPAVFAPGHRHGPARLVADARRRGHVMTTHAAGRLAVRLLRADAYPDRRDGGDWAKLAFPFHWTDAVSALDAIALAGLRRDVPQIASALTWLAGRQERDGLWPTGSPTPRDRERRRAWVSFAAARVMRRFLGDPR